MTVTLDADLSREPDTVLDAALLALYADHRGATDIDRVEIHTAIMAILDEQSRRRWMDGAV